MPIVSPRVYPPLLALLLSFALPSIAAAQEPDEPVPGARLPIGRFAADVRGSMPRFKETAPIADTIGVEPTNLPTRGLGLVFGAHVYPLRMGRVTLGLGGEVMVSRASQTEEAEEPDDDTAPEPPPGPTVKTRFSTLSPQISLNFGASEGWSYISGGMGWSRFSVELETPAIGAPGVETETSPRRKTINYGGGARWFAKKHLAVSFDLRFYAVSPQLQTATHPALPRMTIMVFSLGAGFK
jgi:hypothetical protein